MRSSRPIVLVLAALALLLAPAVATAHGKRHGDAGWHHGSGDHGFPKVSAEFFLNAATQSNRFEIATGQLAQTRASAPEVRALGAMFADHHTRLQQQGDAVAAELGIAVAPGLDPRLQAVVDRLNGLSGSAFDVAWVKAQLWAHKKALKLTLAGSVRGENRAIRTLAQGALPVVADHLGSLLDLVDAARGGGDARKHHHRAGARR